MEEKELFNKVKKYNADLIFVVNSDYIYYIKNTELYGFDFSYKYTEIGYELHAFISGNCEVLIQKRSKEVSEDFIDFLFKLQKVIKKYKGTKSSYDGVFKILESTQYNRVDDDDSETNEIIDVDEDISNIIVAFVIINLSPVYHIVDGGVIYGLKRIYGKDLRSVEFRGNTIDGDGNIECHSIKRYILSYNPELESYHLKE